MNAPLSSPTMGHPSQTQQQSYFSTLTSGATTSGKQGSASASQGQAQPAQAQAAPAQQGKTDATLAFRRDLNLVAEAAKRAQIACLMRDLESIGLSNQER